MRRSRKNSCLVIVSDHTKAIYHDRWVGDVLHYTGMGLRGDQTLSFQNRTLAEAKEQGVGVHLFEVHTPGQYEYKGLVDLVEAPYRETQPDQDGSSRKVWVFPVKPRVSSGGVRTPAESIEKTNSRAVRAAKKLTYDELSRRAAADGAPAASVPVVTVTYYRNGYVSEYARRRAAGICELCRNPAPFKNLQGEPHLEVHHVIWLSRGGTDSVDNTVALCPNCHRRMHVLDDARDREKLAAAARRSMAAN